jgi:hypothetical protein
MGHLLGNVEEPAPGLGREIFAFMIFPRNTLSKQTTTVYFHSVTITDLTLCSL